MNLFKSSLFSPSRLPLLGWLSLVSQILIVVTGGVVRLTGSGLGCPTWPKCTAESLVTVPEMGIHGVIEFANRLLTFVLAIVAIWTFLNVYALGPRFQKKSLNQGLLFPAVILLLGIPAQAVLGGITVLTKLNPWLVGGHFVLSAVLISFATVLVFRIAPPTPKIQGSHEPAPSQRALSHLIAICGSVAILIGVLVTGAGPHSGDAQSDRNGLPLELWQHLHSYPAYLTLILVCIQMFNQKKKKFNPFQVRVIMFLLGALMFQALIGVLQSNLGLPPVLVALHMLGASVLASLITFNWLSLNSKAN